MAMEKTGMKNAIVSKIKVLSDSDKLDPDKVYEAFCDGLIGYLKSNMDVISVVTSDIVDPGIPVAVDPVSHTGFTTGPGTGTGTQTGVGKVV